MTRKQSKYLAFWLVLVMVLVIAMIVLGGATRLTNSGLSITEWRPITGALPPLSEAQWIEEFNKYKEIPEFSVENPDMGLSDFRFIYFMEWSHRQLGRLIGLVYGLPFIVFALRGALPKGQFGSYLAIFLLIGVQGAIGWWMVASGLDAGRVDVSPLRLAVHLGLAFIILGLLFLTYRNLHKDWHFKQIRQMFQGHCGLLLALTYMQIIAGAFVAGTHAGKTYNTWPMMDGKFVPPGYDRLSPFWRNWTENIAAIQFNHRFLAYCICFLSMLLFLRALFRGELVRPAATLFVLICAQSALGILTLLNVVPVHLAMAHQFVAILVFLSALSTWRKARIGY